MVVQADITYGTANVAQGQPQGENFNKKLVFKREKSYQNEFLTKTIDIARPGSTKIWSKERGRPEPPDASSHKDSGPSKEWKGREGGVFFRKTPFLSMAVRQKHREGAN